MTRSSPHRVALLGIVGFLWASGCGEADKGPGEYVTGCEVADMAAPPTPAWAKEAYRSLTGTPPLSVVGAGAVLASVPECSILLTNTSPFLKISPPGRPGKPSPLPPAGTCAPPTGDIYLVQFVYERTPNRVTYEALVADTEFRPNIELWRETNGGRIAQIVFGRVIRGVFADGKMIEGPFAGPDTTFMTSSSGDCR